MKGEIIMGNKTTLIEKARSYIGNNWSHFCNAFGIGCTAWCAAFASVVGRESGNGDIIPWSISCNAQIQWFKDHGCWLGVTNDIREGDYIYYDWDKIAEAKPADHVGIVESVNGDTVVVIEGNKGDAANSVTKVGRRTISRSYSYIFGIARPKYSDSASSTPAQNTDTPMLNKNDRGEAVTKLQRLLIAAGYSCGYCGADGIYGDDTYVAVCAFQKAAGLTADGIVGPLTWGKLSAKSESKPSTPEKTPTPEKTEKPVTPVKPEATEIKLPVSFDTIKNGSKGMEVKTLQIMLTVFGYDVGNCGIDGDFGSGTENAVKAYQNKHKLTVDGIVGVSTWNSLMELWKTIVG